MNNKIVEIGKNFEEIENLKLIFQVLEIIEKKIFFSFNKINLKDFIIKLRIIIKKILQKNRLTNEELNILTLFNFNNYYLKNTDKNKEILFFIEFIENIFFGLEDIKEINFLKLNFKTGKIFLDFMMNIFDKYESDRLKGNLSKPIKKILIDIINKIFPII